MGDAPVLLDRKSGLAVITLNRPEKMNATDLQTLRALLDALKTVASDVDIRAAMLTGAGRAFCAGLDISLIERFQSMREDEFNAIAGIVADCYLAIHEMDKPIIAAVNGPTIGLGLELALSCDIRIAADSARFSAAFMRMGLMTEVSQYMLPRLVGDGRARLLAYTGDTIDAIEAERIGIVEKVVPAASLTAEAQAFALQLAEGPVALRAIKRAINDSSEVSFERSLRAAIHGQYLLTQTPDHAEAVRAYLERRKPNYRAK